MKYTRTVYVYKGEQYNTITEIRRLPDLMNTSIPNNPTDEQLAALGVSREEVMVSLAEAKNIKLPFQFLRWTDNSEIMILNEDGMADDNGENYLTRVQ